MPAKQQYLQTTREIADELLDLDVQRAAKRQEFLEAIYAAVTYGDSTQQEVADRTQYTRSRIGQFLKERRYQLTGS